MSTEPISLELKNKLESLLFSTNKKLSIQELMRLVKERDELIIRQALTEITKDLESRSLRLVEDSEGFRLAVKERYLSVVRKVVTQAELPKSLLETLAVVAYKSPVLQSWVIKVRTNKAYNHLDELESSGFISREKKGRTKLIRLTPKFFEYFELTPEHLKECLKNESNVGEALLHHAKHEHDELSLTDSKGHVVPVASYDTVEKVDIAPVPEPLEIVEEKLGDLEVYSEENKKEVASEISPEASEEIKTEEMIADKTSDGKLPEEFREPKYESKGLFHKGIPPEVEKKVEKRVKEIVEGKVEEEKKSD